MRLQVVTTTSGYDIKLFKGEVSLLRNHWGKGKSI